MQHLPSLLLESCLSNCKQMLPVQLRLEATPWVPVKWLQC